MFNKVTLNAPKRALFKKLINKKSKSRKELIERVHMFLKQEEVASGKMKGDGEEKANHNITTEHQMSI